jgi:hypothetical protein
VTVSQAAGIDVTVSQAHGTCGRLRAARGDPGQAVPVQVMTERERLLRLEVGRFRARESRRVFDVMLQVGTLGGERDSFVVRAQDLPAVDASLRVDVVDSLLEQSGGRWTTAWLVRPGSPEPHDLDLQWLAAARTAFGMHGRDLHGFYVITRAGWRDVLTGESRTWKRLRL